MIKVKPQIEMDENYIINSIERFLRDETIPLNWIIGILKTSNILFLKEILNKLKVHHMNNSRFQELQNKINKLGLI